MLTVNRLKTYDYVVTGEKIEATVKYYNHRDYSLKGKGSRNNKELIIAAIQSFLSNEREQERKAIQTQKDNFKATLNAENIELTSLYNVTLYKHDTYYNGGDYKTNSLLTGIELLDEYDAIAFEPYTINNTDIYTISIQDRLVHADERLIKLVNNIFVTGLALKEKLLTGLKSYNKIRKAVSHELTMLAQLGNKNKTSFVLGAKFNLSDELSMSERYIKEMERAANYTGNVTVSNEYNNEGKLIQYAWFCSKVFNIEEVKEKRYACLEKYVVAEEITVTKEQYNKFITTFDMSDLDSTFTGGSNSTFETEQDFYSMNESNQGKWIAGSYNIALKVNIGGENFSLVIDPQGYEYARYVAIIDNTPDNSTVNNYDCYFKSWDFSPETIADILNQYSIPFYTFGEKFFFKGLTNEQYELVKLISKKNGSILHNEYIAA